MLIIFVVLAVLAVAAAIIMFVNKNLEGETESKKYVGGGVFFLVLAVLFGLIAAANMHTHDYSAATCTEPEVCKVCGETRGSALGHSCEIGVCSNCGEKVNYDVYTKLCDYNNSVNELMTSALEKYDLGNNDDSEDKYDYYEEMFDEFQQNEENLLNISTACGSFEELSKLKESADKLYENLPGSTEVYPTNVSSLLEDAEDFIAAYTEMENEFSEISKLFE